MLSSQDDTACGVDEEAVSDTFFESKNSPRSLPSSTSGHLHPYTTPMQFPIDQDPRGQAKSCSDRLTWKPSQVPLSLVSGSNGVDESCTTQQSVSNEQQDKTEGIVTGPFDYLMSRPGKNFRTQVLSAFNIWLQVDEGSFGIIDKVIGMLHNASLLIDDIQDRSPLRRGSPAAHCVFGSAQTINSANFIYFLAQQELLHLSNWSEAVRIFNEELLNLHRGQGMDLFWRETFTVPTEDEYLRMISNKTGGLFRLATRLMQMVSSRGCNVLPLADLIGLIFQIRDDYKNLSSDQMTAEKGYCEDLTEGKFSFPVIHSLRNSTSDNNDLLNILKLRPENAELKAHAVWYMNTQTNSFEYTKSTLRRLHQQAQKALEDLGNENEVIGSMLARLALD